ncbi:MAG: LysM peptidoglycan-binding domain-containing protein [Dehalococcoidia bacterium]|jgi:hypothetical protein|nr:LysM peptidoglycan-binding domain-containing protein [Dehalococcoidia bacterium]MDW8008305.1 LysM peptidoglycan-binding domain-containing protein [Chloroflexota bacterium]
MECYSCGRAAERRCVRCHRPYCQAHGGGARPFCRECLSPARAAPSGAVYRGSLLALLTGAGIAIWLLVSPPALPGELEPGEPLMGQMRPPPASVGAQPSPSPAPSPTPTPTLTPAPTPTPSPTPTPTPTPALPRFVDYEVQPGDTLLGIAERFPRPGVSTLEQAQAIAFWNNVDFYNPNIRPGDRLKIPQ